jgi:hypothetical protein
MQDCTMPFIGSDALTRGALNRHQLRARYRAACPDVYVLKHAQLALTPRIAADWLWPRREATVAGLAAAA